LLLVILGAGASYDSAASKPPPRFSSTEPLEPLSNRPPLASHLFANRPYFGEVMGKYAQCLPIIPRLRAPLPHSSVELELQRLQGEAIQNLERHRQLAAVRYYLQEILTMCPSQWLGEIQNVCNYSTLIDDIKHWKKSNDKACFVTFNYDTLMDRALKQVGYRFTDLPAHVASDLMLIKLHGSVNWAREVITPCPGLAQMPKTEVASWVIENFPSLALSKNFTMIGECPPPNRGTAALIPALAIPVESKLEFECPASHVEALTEFLPTVTRILMIGWRGMEAPFLELLKTHLQGTPRCLVVGGSKAEAIKIIENLSGKHSIPGQFDRTSGGFTDFTLKREIEGLLH